MKIEWSRRSAADLAALYDYIAQDSPFYAERFVASGVAKAALLDAGEKNSDRMCVSRDSQATARWPTLLLGAATRAL